MISLKRQYLIFVTSFVFGYAHYLVGAQPSLPRVPIMTEDDFNQPDYEKTKEIFLIEINTLTVCVDQLIGKQTTPQSVANLKALIKASEKMHEKCKTLLLNNPGDSELSEGVNTLYRGIQELKAAAVSAESTLVERNQISTTTDLFDKILSANSVFDIAHGYTYLIERLLKKTTKDPRLLKLRDRLQEAQRVSFEMH
jgi:hypothetical protein